MPVREKPEDRTEPDPPRQPRVSVEREVGVSHAVEGAVADAPAVARLSPIEAAKQRAVPAHHDRGRRRRKLRFALVFGAALLGFLPWALRLSDSIGRSAVDGVLGADLLLMGMTMLKVVMATAATGGVSWRLRRRASSGRRFGYVAGAWMIALGVGCIAVRVNHLSGTLLFDAGVLLLLACAIGDDVLRPRDRPSVLPG